MKNNKKKKLSENPWKKPELDDEEDFWHVFLLFISFRRASVDVLV